MKLFKELDEKEKQEYRDWARGNYKPYTDIKGIWHPVIQAECMKINQETGCPCLDCTLNRQ